MKDEKLACDDIFCVEQYHDKGITVSTSRFSIVHVRKIINVSNPKMTLLRESEPTYAVLKSGTIMQGPKIQHKFLMQTNPVRNR
jgi:hypothetical protein